MSDWSPDSDELREEDAVAWYRRGNRAGPQALDHAITALDSAFGRDVDVAAVAPLDELTDEPSVLFVAVSGDIANDETWNRLVDAHRHYVDSPQRVDDAHDRLRLVVATVPGARPLHEAAASWFAR